MTERVTDAEVEAAVKAWIDATSLVDTIRAALEAAAKVRGDKPATTIESLIDTHSMRPPPLSDDGQAWEDGARQGWEWAQTFRSTGQRDEGGAIMSPPLDSLDRGAIVVELARCLYEMEQRFDPGDEPGWDGLAEGQRAFYCELVWGLLTRRRLLARFLELSGERGQLPEPPARGEKASESNG